MKFLIDEMPYFSNECPFYDASIGGICNYMSLPSQEKSEQTECKWLIQKEEEKE